jgi:hypothetical protein
MVKFKTNYIPQNIVCFANLVGLNNANFASIHSIGFYRQLKVGEIVGNYEVKRVWTREQEEFNIKCLK